ncbi:hypothetical protein PJL18_02311 [Paenarthrobacter nicotinovorans]|nr:hypothetical protein [Paenarthrobacter nicotinovorans]
MNMNDVDLQTSLSKNNGVVRHTPFSKSKLMIAGAVLALLALIPLLFGVVNWACLFSPSDAADESKSV